MLDTEQERRAKKRFWKLMRALHAARDAFSPDRLGPEIEAAFGAALDREWRSLSEDERAHAEREFGTEGARF